MRRIAAAVSLLLFFLSAAPVAGQASLRVGRAAVRITPPVGSIMGNSYGITVAEGVHDDLFAKALVFEQDGVRAALVACDLISLRRPIVEEARRRIEEATGIPGTHVVLTATHAHAGPQLNPLFWEAVGGAPRARSEAYVERLPALLAQSVEQAVADLRPARASVATVREEALGFNRRFLMRDGSVRMNPGRQNPESVRAVGPTDPALSVVLFESLDERPLAVLVNFALHVAVVGGDHFSADYPATLAALLGQVYGEELLTVFTNGTSGNINHVDVTQPDALDGQAEAARIGTILAAGVLKALPARRPVRVHPLRVRTDAVVLPAPVPAPDEVTWARGIMARYGRPEAPSFQDVVRAWRILDQAALGGRGLETEVQAITFGDELALVGFPGDAFVELGLAIKQNSPFAHTIVSEQAGNGAISYVPNRKAFPEGGYEVISARFEPGGGERLVEAAVGLLIDLFPRGPVQEAGDREPARKERPGRP